MTSLAAARAERAAAELRARVAVVNAARRSPSLTELWIDLLPQRPFNEADLSSALTDLIASGRIILDDDQHISLSEAP